MGEELSVARKEKEGQSMLLVRTGSGKAITTSYSGNKRTQEPSSLKGSNGRAAKSTETKSQGSGKTKGANARSTKQARRGRDNKDRKSNRKHEREDRIIGRSAQNMGIVHPGSYCDELEAIPHYWREVEKVCEGSLLRCMNCYKYIWLPLSEHEAERMGKLMRSSGKDEGYCEYLDRNRGAKIIVAKMQDLGRMEAEATDKRKFARLVDKVMSDRNYDRKEK